MRDLISEILDRVKYAKDLAVETVSTGSNIEDFAKYQRVLGELTGLEKALNIIDDVMTESDKDDS
jgi:hypothetical protein